MEIKRTMETLVVEDVNLSGSSFRDVNMSATQFHDIGLRGATLESISFDGATLHHVGFVDCELDDVDLTGALFRYIRLPKATANAGTVGPGETVRFEHCDLRGARISQCNLSNADISGCDLTGLRINGILIGELLDGRGPDNG